MYGIATGAILLSNLPKNRERERERERGNQHRITCNSICCFLFFCFLSRREREREREQHRITCAVVTHIVLLLRVPVFRYSARLRPPPLAGRRPLQLAARRLAGWPPAVGRRPPAASRLGPRGPHGCPGTITCARGPWTNYTGPSGPSGQWGQ